jgi:hypothetical protein
VSARGVIPGQAFWRDRMRLAAQPVGIAEGAASTHSQRNRAFPHFHVHPRSIFLIFVN